MSLDVFVGRKDELERYREFLKKDTPWVLIIRGLGGIGKSTLLIELEKQIPQDTCVVKLDFAEETPREDYLTSLGNISQQVERYCDAERTVEFKKSIVTGRLEIGKSAARGRIDIINQSIKVGNDAKVSDTALNAEAGEAAPHETLLQMREMAREMFYAQMRTFSLKRLVIMLDSCEWINEKTAASKAARWAGTELIKGLRSRMLSQGKQCFVVMTSRVELELEGINKSEQKQLQLEMLDKADVKQYLEAMEVHNPAIQDYIYDMTYGHPDSIAIVCNIWDEKWDRRSFTLEDLPKLKDLFYERAMWDVIDKDIMEHLLKSPLDKLTRYGVLLRRFNLPLLQAVFQEWLPEPEASYRFNQLIRYPHVESVGNFNYTFHKLLREILARYIRKQEPEKWRGYHELALNFLSPKGESPQKPLRSPDCYYHLLAYDEELGVSYWNDVKTRAPQEYIDELREAARDKTLKLTLATMQCMDILRDAMGNIA